MGAVNSLEGEIASLKEENRFLRTKILDLALKVAVPPKGPTRPNRRKLTDREVKDIRAAWEGGVSQRDIADSYEVNPATVSRIVQGFYHK